MANDLISREALIADLRTAKGLGLIIAETIVRFLKKQPTVDAVEVVHGQWEPVDHDGSWRVDMCSICHRRMHYVDYDQPYQYCPNCGADMRERKDNG